MLSQNEFRKILQTPVVRSGAGQLPPEAQTHRQQPQPKRQESTVVKGASGTVYRDRAAERRLGVVRDDGGAGASRQTKKSQFDDDEEDEIPMHNKLDSKLYVETVMVMIFRTPTALDVPVPVYDDAHAAKGLDYELLDKIRTEQREKEKKIQEELQEQAQARSAYRVIDMTRAPQPEVGTTVMGKAVMKAMKGLTVGSEGSAASIFGGNRTAYRFDLEDDFAATVPALIVRARTTDTMSNSNVDDRTLLSISRVISTVGKLSSKVYKELKKKEDDRIKREEDEAKIKAEVVVQPTAQHVPPVDDDDIYDDIGEYVAPEAKNVLEPSHEPMLTDKMKVERERIVEEQERQAVLEAEKQKKELATRERLRKLMEGSSEYDMNIGDMDNEIFEQDRDQVIASFKSKLTDEEIDRLKSDPEAYNAYLAKLESSQSRSTFMFGGESHKDAKEKKMDRKRDNVRLDNEMRRIEKLMDDKKKGPGQKRDRDAGGIALFDPDYDPKRKNARQNSDDVE